MKRRTANPDTCRNGVNVPLPGIVTLAAHSIFFTDLNTTNDAGNAWAADNVWPDCEDSYSAQPALHAACYTKQHLTDN